MHPILFHIGPITVRTYGALVAVAFVAALRIAQSAARHRHIAETFLLDLVAVVTLSGLLGARLFYVLLNPKYFLSHPLEVFAIWQGGLVFYGGFLVATAVGIWYTKRKHANAAVVADCLAPALAIGQSIGRWGCFFAGCCYGKASSVPWAVTYRNPASLAPLEIAMHPVQIYESLGSLAIAGILWFRLNQRRAVNGEVFWLYIFLYGALRFSVEVLRGDDRGPTLGGLFPSQIIAILAMLLAGSVLVALNSDPNPRRRAVHR